MSISDDKAKDLRGAFMQYILGKYPERKDTSNIVSDSFYPLRHNIGMTLWDILENDVSMKNGQKCLKDYFCNQGNRKSPENDASAYLSSIRYLKEFIDHSLGGVKQFFDNDGCKLNNEIIPQSYAQLKTGKKAFSRKKLFRK